MTRNLLIEPRFPVAQDRHGHNYQLYRTFDPTQACVPAPNRGKRHVWDNHRAGLNKYALLGLPEPRLDAAVPDDQTLDRWRALLAQCGVLNWSIQ